MRKPQTSRESISEKRRPASPGCTSEFPRRGPWASGEASSNASGRPGASGFLLSTIKGSTELQAPSRRLHSGPAGWWDHHFQTSTEGAGVGGARGRPGHPCRQAPSGLVTSCPLWPTLRLQQAGQRPFSQFRDEKIEAQRHSYALKSHTAGFAEKRVVQEGRG